VKVRTPSGETVVVRRQWLPWRQKPRDVDPNFAGAIDGGGIDHPAGILVMLLLILLAPVIAFLLVTVGEFLILVALLPLFLAGRLGWVMTWTVLVKRDGQLLGTRKVKGWTESGVLIHDVAAAAERGDDPLSVSP
jgi:hypothetical protein